MRVQARTGQQFRRVDHVHRASLVNENLNPRVLPYERTGHPSVVEVDVGQQNLPDIGDGDSLPAKGFFETLVRGRRSGIDERHTRRVVKDCGGYDFGDSEKVQVDVIESGGKRQHG
jgi:hypothetical protein